MNAPFRPAGALVRLADLADPDERRRIAGYVDAHQGATIFHQPRWIRAVAQGTGNRAMALLEERHGEIAGYLPLTEAHSPLFGRVLVSSGFAVEGGLLADEGCDRTAIFAALEELASRRSCPAIELRGGLLPQGPGWQQRSDTHCGFVAPLATDDIAQLDRIPRKQRAEVRKGLANDLRVTVGCDARDRAAHYAVYAESVRNLGTPVFPRTLFAAVLDAFGDDADVLTVWDGAVPVASVLSFYHRGAVMPYWGGGTAAARRLRANDRMYFELMLHARRRGCQEFDFGRSKTGSGAFQFKRNWGFEPHRLTYGSWTAPGTVPRDADPASPRHAARIALWRRLPLSLANRLGPLIARGLA